MTTSTRTAGDIRVEIEHAIDAMLTATRIAQSFQEEAWRRARAEGLEAPTNEMGEWRLARTNSVEAACQRERLSGLIRELTEVA
jgi:hypothetical protein